MKRNGQRSERESLIAIWQGWFEGEAEEDRKKSPVNQRFRLREFVSYRGFGKKRLRPREVVLLGIDGIGFQEMGAKSHKRSLRLDSYAEEVLKHLDPDERTVEKVIEILRNCNGK